MEKPQELKHRYRKVACRIWNDEWFRSLPQHAQWLFLYLLTNQEMTSIGVQLGTLKHLKHELQWTRKRINGVLELPLWRKKVIESEKDNVLYLPSFLTYNRPESPNVIRSWHHILDSIPDGAAKDMIIKNTAEYVKGYTKGFREAFKEILAKPSPKAKPYPELELELLQELLPEAFDQNARIEAEAKEDSRSKIKQGNSENDLEEPEPKPADDWRDEFPKIINGLIGRWDDIFQKQFGTDTKVFGPINASILSQWIESENGQQIIAEYETYGLNCFWNVMRWRFLDLADGVKDPAKYLVTGITSRSDPYLLKPTATEENSDYGNYRVKFRKERA